MFLTAGRIDQHALQALFTTHDIAEDRHLSHHHLFNDHDLGSP